MTDLTYHLESVTQNGKHYLAVKLTGNQKLTPATASEKAALESLLKEPLVSANRSFELLKLLGTTGRIFYQGKKVFIDPFTPLKISFEGEKLQNTQARFFGKCLFGPLEKCDLVFPGDPSWVLHGGILRPIEEEISKHWVSQGMLSPFTLEGPALVQFLDKAEGEVQIDWKTPLELAPPEPLPFLVLTDRHGGFANLWFEYGAFGKVAAHEAATSSFRNLAAEKAWEKDLLETDFNKKLLEGSHYYCPLDKVAKSLTFLIEIGWWVIDASGRRVLREKKVDFDIDVEEKRIVVRGRFAYGEHEVDLKGLVGAFNRRENFVELSPQTVALIDRDAFGQEWGDFAEQEIVAEGICLKKNQMGLLASFLEKNPREEIRDKISKLGAIGGPVEVGKNFQGTLFSYQQKGLEWLKFLECGGFGGLLADEMGLGKTVQVLALFSLLTWENPLLIVVPTSLLFNWQKEIEKFVPTLSVYRHEGKMRLRTPEELRQKQVILTSYALLRLDFALLQTIDYQCLVLDEAQAIKNPESQTSKACCQIRSKMRLAITGTPVENRLEDLWSIFHFLQPDLLGDKKQFQVEAALAHLANRMKKKIRPFLLRRKKADLNLQLPPKFEQVVHVEMTEPQREIYEQWLQNTKKGLLRKVSLDGAASHRMEILEAILRLRQLCAHPWLIEERQSQDPCCLSGKFERLMADLQEVVQEKQKVLVYSQFTSMLKLIQTEVNKQGWKHVYLDGSTQNREEVVSQFQEDPETLIFLISLKAGGVGLNLTAADYVFLYDPWWNEAVEQQAIDRAHRLGKQGAVIARRYVTALSIEEKIMRLKEHKRALSTHLLEMEGEFNSVSLDDLLELLS
jgi:superfamily II DNA or RNA helicase